ncbi:PIN domain nuclease [Pseudonocardia nantongensis]|uniref:type II toxin-antitoxin system VapC family toxin n=1 Tax=Pseudonocardia nantongensis TaxID=1181885 RepID=UPI00397875E3
MPDAYDVPYLVDSSAWIEYLRATGSPANAEVRRLLRTEPERVATTEPVIMELLAGASDAAVFDKLATLTSGLRQLSLTPMVDFHTAATAYRSARTGGRTVRKLLDCVIAAVAVRTGAVLVHRDRDFDELAEVLPDLCVVSLR